MGAGSLAKTCNYQWQRNKQQDSYLLLLVCGQPTTTVFFYPEYTLGKGGTCQQRLVRERQKYIQKKHKCKFSFSF